MKNAMGVLAASFCVFITPAVMASGPVTPAPEYVPYCTTPQITAPMQLAGGANLYSQSSAVWNGKDYAVAWADGADYRIHFRRFFADGTPAAAGVISSTVEAFVGSQPSLVWNGSGYGLAWQAAGGAYYQIYFARLNTDGTLNGNEVRVSQYGSTPTINCYAPALAWSGAGYAVAWYDLRGPSYDIYATLLNADGTIAGATNNLHDIAICTAANDQTYPAIAWSPAATRYVLAWQDSRSGTKYEIWGANLTPAGVVSSSLSIVSSTNSSYSPSLAAMPDGLGLAWYDYRDGNNEIYFARLHAFGYKIGSDLRLTNNVNNSMFPQIVWTGAEFGVFWMDDRTNNFDVWFQRVSAGGTAVGSNAQVTTTSESDYPGAAFANYGYLATCAAASYGYANFVQAWGCAADTTPPTCPGGFVAYNITGTAATIGWLPSGDPETDLAYYIVYRNAIPIAKTSDRFYPDSGLSLSTTYAYSVEPVNAAQLQNYSCQTTFYLKTNATLLLMLNKSDPNAKLTWSDISLTNYNVFRGTSPQVMSQIGSTGGCQFDDPNVLTDNVLYFYTVDEPGW